VRQVGYFQEFVTSHVHVEICPFSLLQIKCDIRMRRNSCMCVSTLVSL